MAYADIKKQQTVFVLLWCESTGLKLPCVGGAVFKASILKLRWMLAHIPFSRHCGLVLALM